MNFIEFRSIRILWVLCLAALVPLFARAAPVTSFAYQGQLQRLGEPYEGSVSLTFRLYDAAAGGSQIGRDLVIDDVVVSGGLFTVELDFGSGVFDGNGRWLDIHVGRSP